MASEDNLVKLKALRALAERVKEECATKEEYNSLKKTVDGIVSSGGEANVIEEIQVNGVKQTVTSKRVNITVPTRVGALTNDSGYQTASQVAASIAAAGHASFEVVSSVPAATSAKDNVLYLVKNSSTGYYDIYAKVTESGTAKVERLDDVSVDLSGYAKGPASATTGHVVTFSDSTGKVLKDSGYTIAKSVPSDAKFTDTVYTHPTSSSGGSKASGLYKITTDTYGHISAATLATGTDIKNLSPYSRATQSTDGLMSATDKLKLDGLEAAADEDVEAMLEEVFSAA